MSNWSRTYPEATTWYDNRAFASFQAYGMGWETLNVVEELTSSIVEVSVSWACQTAVSLESVVTDSVGMS